NPSFLAARDAILRASTDLATARGDDDAARAAFMVSVWQTFARFGMGPGARTNGATLTGIVADFPVPSSGSPHTTTAGATVTPQLPIPDADVAGVRSAVDLTASGVVADISVTVDITHTYRGDLVVTLVSPDGRTAVVHNRAGGSSRNLKETWTSQGSQASP